jgi:hypothetical protein
MGAGIAVEFQKQFGLKGVLLCIDKEERKYPTCIQVKSVFNLITKERYWHKPTLNSLGVSLIAMKEIVIRDNVRYLAMPKIGSGLDRLSWVEVRRLIKEIFKDVDVEILVCYL